MSSCGGREHHALQLRRNCLILLGALHLRRTRGLGRYAGILVGFPIGSDRPTGMILYSGLKSITLVSREGQAHGGPRNLSLGYSPHKFMKTALIFYGGWSGHQPVETTQLFTGILEEDGFAVRVTESLDALLNVTDLMTNDLIIPNWTLGQLSGDQSRALSTAVSRGCGFGGWHGGMGDAFRDNTHYQFMTGGQFVSHPGGIKKYAVHITDREHAITKGLGDFAMESEQYYLHIDPANKVLATTTFDAPDTPWISGTVMPVVWTKKWGDGKVFYCSLGHVVGDFDVRECREIIRRGLNWAARP